MNICDCVLHSEMFLLLKEQGEKRVVSEQCYLIESVGGIQAHLITSIVSCVCTRPVNTWFSGMSFVVLVPTQHKGCCPRAAGRRCWMGCSPRSCVRRAQRLWWEPLLPGTGTPCSFLRWRTASPGSGITSLLGPSGIAAWQMKCRTYGKNRVFGLGFFFGGCCSGDDV